MSQKCSNCQTLLPAKANYCSHCGQSTQSHRQDIVVFAKNSLHELLDIDGRLSVTLKTLLTKPGLIAHEYDKGVRVKYTPALRLYLAASVIFFLVFTSFHHLYTGQERYSSSMVELYSRAMFFLFPIYAFYVKLLYRDSYIISNIVLSLHIHTVGYLVLMVIGPLEALESLHIGFLVMQAPFAIYFLWYFVSAFKTMFKQPWPTTLLKAFIIYMLYMGTLGIAFDIVLAV